MLLITLGIVKHVVIDETDWARMGTLEYTMGLMARFAPDLAYMPSVVGPLLDTFLIAVLGTCVAIVLSLPVAYLGARNITPLYPITFAAGRSAMAVSRSTHEIIWGLLFVSALGLGALPGILAIGCRSVGFLAKTTAEAMENAKPGPIEAIEATGAGRLQVVMFGIVPQVLALFLGNAIFQLDMNLRRAAIMGMVGAGGIGLLFAEHMMILEYDKAASVVVAIVLMVVAGEIISNRIRTRLI
ncbi:MAG: phosphonate ABC transporter, permease protein PhnE [Candidatus Methylomirabilia bacterium]